LREAPGDIEQLSYPKSCMAYKDCSLGAEIIVQRPN